MIPVKHIILSCAQNTQVVHVISEVCLKLSFVRNLVTTLPKTNILYPRMDVWKNAFPFQMG